MPLKPKTHPYGPLERDLCQLAATRVSDAVNSVLQLADTKETQFMISMHAMTQAIGMCVGAFSAVYVGHPQPRDPHELAKLVLDLAKKAGDEAGQKKDAT